MKEDTPFKLGLPHFPHFAATTKLSSLIGKQSWLLFQVLGISSDWLQLSPSLWQSDDAYQKIAMVARNFKVVNDLAERAVKLITTFSTTIIKDETQKQCLLQIVEYHRSQIPDFNKSSLCSNKS
jgi:hypothetical protein